MLKISEPELQSRLLKIKLLALDVDGVLTDGGLYYTESGEELKKFNIKDGQGLKKLMQFGVEVAIISANSSKSTLQRTQKLGITHSFINVEDKLSVLKDLCLQLSISLSEVAYVGDDDNDLPVLQAVGCPFTVADAMPENKARAIYVTKKSGGQGAVREICDLLINSRLNFKNQFICA
ncbi:HAD family hydrolase [Chroococcidiopsis sp. CCALA 051]|uniref:KdsC family phosphatase n=1 Tax=Chroococcidiopsis sp. CCALA 051 TaxID=869949 RepID=UPI000D0D4B02|nr:HAD-IIIA family hydrolase [Chroococcidiopsis sp. CCALA 051]MBE9015300.1 HAD-IIIA family hydrolase [Chroococcidiopsidales cyanobacterium LEGE 13417]PSM46776.1 HAD family hydrolase [Chroococcidiopsis sp. CCALA 051]